MLDKGRQENKEDADADRRCGRSGAGEEGGEARMECTDGRGGLLSGVRG